MNYCSTKTVRTIACLFVTISLLTGCASFAQQRALKNNCAISPVLITNLTSSTTHHQVMLPDGRICPNEVM